MKKTTQKSMICILVALVLIFPINTIISERDNKDKIEKMNNAFNKEHLCSSCKDYPTTSEDSESYWDFGYREKEEVEKELKEIREAIKENNANWTADYTPILSSTFYMNSKWPGWIDEEVGECETISFEGLAQDEFDWRNVNGTDWTTSIKNQGSCGSCVAFATIGALESVAQISVGYPFDCDLSEAHLFFCGGGNCDEGWYFSEAADYVRKYGAPDEACFPYEPRDIPCSETESNWKQRAVKVERTGKIGGISDMQEALLIYGPLVARMEVYTDFYSYRGGIYEHVSGDYEDGHGVTIVGYNNNPGYWICKNSWGTGWGEQGYFKIKYGECKIGEPTYYLSGISGNIQPLAPRNPTPYDGEVNIDIETNLSWTCGDPDGDTVYYDIYLAKDCSPTENDIIARHHNSTSFHVKNLEKNSRYYWKIVAEDENGSKCEGAIWNFITIETMPPVVKIIDPEEGYLYWTLPSGEFTRKIPFLIPNSFIIGSIVVNVDAYDSGSGINRLEFYVNDVLRSTVTRSPYMWSWNETSFGLSLFRLKVIAYDNAGNLASEETRVRFFNP